MDTLRLADRARRRLVSVLDDDHPENERWLSRLRSWSAEEAQPAFSNAVRLLFHLELSEEDAESLIGRVLAHRDQMASALGRDPGLRVAGVDYLSNVEALLAHPKIVEMEDFERTERRARTDALTGLFNRRHFRSALDQEVRRARRYRSPVALLMLDADHFKEINDVHGHVLGDRVLARVGALLRRSVREADAACRLGGEEFAVVLPETPRLGAYALGERIRNRVEDAFASTDVAGVRVPFTMSGGIACLPEDGTSATALLERADRALYAAKERGRNRIVVYHDEKRAAVRFPARREVHVLMREPDGQAHPARMIDVSRSGALVESERVPSPAARIEVGVEAPPPPECARGRVVRVVEAKVGPGGRAGVAFDAPIADDLLWGRLAANVNPSEGGRGMRR